jgi:hypothetical protein
MPSPMDLWQSREQLLNQQMQQNKTVQDITNKYGMNQSFRGGSGTMTGLVNPASYGGGSVQSNARQELIGPLQQNQQRLSGRPVGTATGMGMTPPSMQTFNPVFKNLNRGGGVPMARPNANGIMNKYGMGGYGGGV